MGLGFLHELHQEIYALAVAVQALQADRATVSKLVRLERTSTAKRDNAVSATLQSLSNIVRAVIGRGDELTLPPTSLGPLKSFFRWLAGSLQNLVNVSGRPDLDQALLNASFAIARDAYAHSSTAEIKDLSLVVDIQQHLNTVARQDTRGWGSAMVSLWEALRPATPATIEDLKDLLRLEGIVSQFDQTAQNFQLPVEVIAGLRVSFARALGRAKAGGTDVDQLAEKLKAIMPAPTVNESEQSDETMQIEKPAPAKPHFAAVFSELTRHFDLLRLSGQTINTDEQASLHVLAMQRTSEFILDVNASKSQSQWIFNLLGAVARPRSVDEGASQKSLSDIMLQHLTSRGSVSVDRLSLLESEMAILGKTLASQTDLVVRDVLPTLNEGLRQLLNAVLGTLSEHRDDAIRSTSQALYTIMQSADLQALKHLVSSQRLPDELKGFASSVNHVLDLSNNVSSPKAASQAWLSFATSCLRLYLPATQFDPALEPLLRRQVYDSVSEDLARKVASLRNFTSALTGEQTSLRLRLLEDEVASLGAAPEAPSICRPLVSELADMQMDFDALRRILTTIEKDSAMIMDRGLLVNIQHIRKRLSEHYRAYADLTTPVVGLLDCFDICNYLAQEDNSSEDDEQPGSKLQTAVPFFNASIADWSSDALVSTLR